MFAEDACQWKRRRLSTEKGSGTPTSQQLSRGKGQLPRQSLQAKISFAWIAPWKREEDGTRSLSVGAGSLPLRAGRARMRPQLLPATGGHGSWLVQPTRRERPLTAEISRNARNNGKPGRRLDQSRAQAGTMTPPARNAVCNGQKNLPTPHNTSHLRHFDEHSEEKSREGKVRSGETTEPGALTGHFAGRGLRRPGQLAPLIDYARSSSSTCRSSVAMADLVSGFMA